METETLVESEQEKGFNYSTTRSKYYACNRAKYGCTAKFINNNGKAININLNHNHSKQSTKRAPSITDGNGLQHPNSSNKSKGVEYQFEGI